MPTPQTNGPPNAGPVPDRSSLANYRTNLALDRTTLAWIRTTLSMTTFGFGTIGFFRTLREKYPTPLTIQIHEDAIRFGVALIVLGAVASVLVAISHWSSLRKLRRNETPDIGAWPLSVTLAWLLAIVSLVALWLLFDNAPHGVAG
jgi:putative membrane protein